MVSLRVSHCTEFAPRDLRIFGLRTEVTQLSSFGFLLARDDALIDELLALPPTAHVFLVCLALTRSVRRPPRWLIG